MNKSRHQITMISPVVIINMKIFFNGDSNNDRASVLRNTSSDNNSLQRNDFGDFFTTSNNPNALPNIEEWNDNDFDLCSITDTNTGESACKVQ